MVSLQQLDKDLKTLGINKETTLDVKLVTTQYKKLAKTIHPDKSGSTESFQELQNAFKRTIAFIEKQDENATEKSNFETDFFMKHNLVKECTSSFVIYIEEHLANTWKHVFDKNLTTHDVGDTRTIYKTDIITITLYLKPKRDPRSKLHIQSRDQQKNLEFIIEKLSVFYKEVSASALKELQPPLRIYEKVTCTQCGKQFVNKGGLKRHLLRMHAIKNVSTEARQSDIFTLEESDGSSDQVQVALQVVKASNMVQDILDEVISEPTTETEVPKVYLCGECAESFQSQELIDCHMKSSHSNNPREVIDALNEEELLTER